MLDLGESLLRHMEDLAARAKKTGAAHSKFLTPAEQEAVRRHFRDRRDVRLSMESGFCGSCGARAGDGEPGVGGWPEPGGGEARADAGSDAGAGSIPPAVGGGSDSFAGEHRRIAVFLQPEWGSCAAGELISAFQADVSGREPVGHRDVLGALMACGVEREAVGEIVAEGATAYFFCLASVARFISGNISKIGRSAASLRAIPAAQVPLAAGAPRAKTVTVASMRLDTLIGEGFGVSRGASAELVRRGMASVNHVACEKPDRKIEPGDLLSVRGKGRLKVVSAGSLSRKGRIFVELGVYG